MPLKRVRIRITSVIVHCLDRYKRGIVETPLSLSAYFWCLMHTGKPHDVAMSHCITWLQTQLILTACQMPYQSQF